MAASSGRAGALPGGGPDSRQAGCRRGADPRRAGPGASLLGRHLLGALGRGNLAIPAIQILGGAVPVQHVGVEDVGATAAYFMAAWFALAGVSTVALDVFG